jgi:hypothetical protein
MGTTRLRPPGRRAHSPRYTVSPVREELLDRYAERIVGLGANDQPDQVGSVGSDEVMVSGVTRSGDELPLLPGGSWQV